MENKFILLEEIRSFGKRNSRNVCGRMNKDKEKNLL